MSTSKPSIRVRCPHCEAILKSSPAVAGRNVRCPKCSHSFNVSPETVVTTGGTSQSELVTPIRDEERLDPFDGWDVRPNPVTARRSPKTSSTSAPQTPSLQQASAQPLPHDPEQQPAGATQMPQPPFSSDQFFASRYARRQSSFPAVLVAAVVAVMAGAGLGVMWSQPQPKVMATRADDGSIELEPALRQQRPARPIQMRAVSDDSDRSREVGVVHIVMALVLLLIGFGIYVGPSIVAYSRGHSNFVPILIVNICLGWTFVTWILCLAWAFSSNVQRIKEIEIRRD